MTLYDFTPEENIQRYLTRLDQVRVEYESRWGVSKLPGLISEELRGKWERQCSKLDTAAQERRVNDVAELVEGSIRAYGAMEREALARGHKMHDAEMWDVEHPESKQVYRIVKNNYDAGISLKDGVRVYTLVEVARILEKKDTINAVKDVFPDATVAKIQGKEHWNDDIPF